MEAQELEQAAAFYGDMIYRIALGYTRIPQDAEDVLQEVLLERYRTATDLSAPEHEKRWLIRVAVNKSKNLLRAGKRRRSVPLDEAVELPAPPAESQALLDAVRTLPPNWQTVVDLYYYEGYSTGEIASILVAREATVRTWLRRARLRLKTILKEAWDDDES